MYKIKPTQQQAKDYLKQQKEAYLGNYYGSHHILISCAHNSKRSQRYKTISDRQAYSLDKISLKRFDESKMLPRSIQQSAARVQYLAESNKKIIRFLISQNKANRKNDINYSFSKKFNQKLMTNKKIKTERSLKISQQRQRKQSPSYIKLQKKLLKSQKIENKKNVLKQNQMKTLSFYNQIAEQLKKQSIKSIKDYLNYADNPHQNEKKVRKIKRKISNISLNQQTKKKKNDNKLMIIEEEKKQTKTNRQIIKKESNPDNDQKIVQIIRKRMTSNKQIKLIEDQYKNQKCDYKQIQSQLMNSSLEFIYRKYKNQGFLHDNIKRNKKMSLKLSIPLNMKSYEAKLQEQLTPWEDDTQ